MTGYYKIMDLVADPNGNVLYGAYETPQELNAAYRALREELKATGLALVDDYRSLRAWETDEIGQTVGFPKYYYMTNY